jgi:hypothetical protein
MVAKSAAGWVTHQLASRGILIVLYRQVKKLEEVYRWNEGWIGGWLA